MPLLSSSRKAEAFARLLEGSGNAGSGSELSTMQQLASRLSAVPQPRAEFASALRDRLMSEAATTLPSAASGAAGSGAGSGGTGSGGTGAGGTGSGGPASGAGASGTGAGSGAGSGGTAAGSTGPAISSATGTGGSSAAGSAASAVSTATGGSAAGGSVVSAVMSATAPAWAQFIGVVAATAIAIGGVGVGASQSLPGDPLYGVKRQIEQIQFDLAGGHTDKAIAELGFAHARLSEIAELLHGRSADAPLPADLQKRISELLTDWAFNTSQGTTALLDQLSTASGDLSAIRLKLTDFTDSQARALALVVQQLPDQRLQSLTGSAIAYLQRIDTALGNPVNLATLLPSLGLPLPTTTGSTVTPPSGKTTTDQPSGASSGSTTNTPSSVPTLPIPTNGSTTPTDSGSTPSTPKVPSTTLPSGGGSGTGPVGNLGGTVGNTAGGVTGSVGTTVTGVLNGVTGKGPSLPLPTSVPSLPR